MHEFEDVFPIEYRDFPASHVSLLEGKFRRKHRRIVLRNAKAIDLSPRLQERTRWVGGPWVVARRATSEKFGENEY